MFDFIRGLCGIVGLLSFVTIVTTNNDLLGIAAIILFILSWCCGCYLIILPKRAVIEYFKQSYDGSMNDIKVFLLEYKRIEIGDKELAKILSKLHKKGVILIENGRWYKP